MPDNWVLIFSDGTGQRGVRDDNATRYTNVFQMYTASYDKAYLETFYDPGLGAPEEEDKSWGRKASDLWSKATGGGITANIVDCYDALLRLWNPGKKIGLFGFSRGAYTARCVGGVLSTCGLATELDGQPLSRDLTGPGAVARRKIAEEAVAVYKIDDKARRKSRGASLAHRTAAAPVVPDVVGVFDTVKSLGLPGIMNIANPWKHEFHDNRLSSRVPVGLHALSIDENRKQFLPELWDDVDEEGRAHGQIIEQVWFPGVHSDIGGGYQDDYKLADLTLDWMLNRLRDAARLHIPLTVTGTDHVLGKDHNERTGWGKFWLPAMRSIRGESHDVAPLYHLIEDRFDRYSPRYRPPCLARHPRVMSRYA